MNYALYQLPAGDLNIPLAACIAAYRSRNGTHPTIALAHPARIAAVQVVLPFARTRQPGEPIPHTSDLLLACQEA